jgi:UDP-N-acetylmuramoyl-L-alanyl-D-glutamate--2,6-diaminopimelate ligase
MMPAASFAAATTLAELFGADVPPELAGTTVSDLSADSRRVTPGGLFLACHGASAHGLDFVADALERGAAAVVWEPQTAGQPAGLALPVPAFPVAGLRQRLGDIADRFFRQPTAHLRVMGITGTNGKTTTAHLIAGAFERLGHPAGLIGTLGCGRVGRLTPGRLTTPDAVETHRALAGIRADGGEVVAMEVSSHALDQNRIGAVRLAAAALTNLSREHLDYHGDMATYGAAKARLFRWPGLRQAVVNIDSEFGARLFESLPDTLERVAVSRASRAAGARTLCLERIDAGADGLRISYDGPWGAGVLESRLWGEFNADNLGVALAMLLLAGLPHAAAAEALAALDAPPGRMEIFRPAGPGPVVIVDYAHTPDALEKALAAARAHCTGGVSCVFGCGGERDRGKRPQMGATAERGADHVIVTDDNPRGEDGARIVAEIVAGMRGKPRVVRRRDEAIRTAVNGAGAGDVVLVAGKGHEDYQIVGHERTPFSDREFVAALQEGDG